jgi:hypothetical protein
MAGTEIVTQTVGERRLLSALDRHRKLMRDSTLSVQLPEWAANLREFVRFYPDDWPSIDQLVLPFEKDITITGSGRSLEGFRETRGSHSMLIAGATNAGYLLRRGIRVDAIMVADANPLLREYLCGYEEELKNTPIILPVIAHPAWRQKPIGRPYYFIPLFLDEGGKIDTPVNRLLLEFSRPAGRMKPWLAQAGCAVNMALQLCGFVAQTHPSMSLTFSGVDFASADSWNRVPVVMKNHASYFPAAGRGPAPSAYFSPDTRVSYQDILYATNFLALLRDMPFEVSWKGGTKSSIVYPYIRPTQKGRREALYEFVSDTAPFLEEIESQLKEMAGDKAQGEVEDEEVPTPESEVEV